jgi:hypothetical protein
MLNGWLSTMTFQWVWTVFTWLVNKAKGILHIKYKEERTCLFLLSLDQGLVYFSIKTWIVNILGFVDHAVFGVPLNLTVKCKSTYRQYVNTGVWLYSNKTLFKKTVGRQDLASFVFFSRKTVQEWFVRSKMIK